MKQRYTLLIMAVLIVLGLGLGFFQPVWAGKPLITLTDSQGTTLVLPRLPQRIASLSPAATEVLDALGIQETLKGVTYHDSKLGAARTARLLGGISNPSVSRLAALNPDLVIATTFHQEIIDDYRAQGKAVFVYQTQSIDQGFENIIRLGKLVGRENAARAIVRQNREQLAHISAKLNQMNLTSPKRVMRLMGRDTVMTPGNDSFMNDLIRAAGGLPPDFGRGGAIIAVTKAEWEAFNPELIYGCPPDKEVEALFDQPGWKDVDAVRKGQIHYFPCDMTCRASIKTGDFVAWLSSVIYPKEFAQAENQLIEPRVFKSKILEVDQDYLESARILYAYTADFKNKTLVLNFKTPRDIVSTLDGHRPGVRSVANHYFPPPTWIPGHYMGMDFMKANVLKVLKRDPDSTAFLMTGADMDHVAMATQTYKDLKITALVTAGVSSNAMRMGKDTGSYYEPGTINVILLSNMKLSQRAMTRAIITATEAKTAVMEDIDIRSTYNPAKYAATGTGTDNVLVVSGDGPELTNAGGHSKLGELVARAVYDGVRQAVANHNKIRGDRDIFRRLEERNIHVFQLASGADCGCREKKSDFAAMVEYVLLQPQYAGFMASALALSDAHQRGLVTDLAAFDAWCLTMAADIAGETPDELEELVTDPAIPVVVRRALNAVMTGARLRVAATGDSDE